MITRPLDLASKLRRPPRSFDAVFMINGVLIGLFFTLFGSRFVLSPGLGVDFKLPESVYAVAGAAPTDVVIRVKRTDMVFVEDAVLDFNQLRQWLMERGKRQKGLRLLVQADALLNNEDLAAITDMAWQAGFKFHLALESPSK